MADNIYLVLAVKKYDFTSRDNGGRIQGMSITALDTAEIANESDRKGIDPMKIKSPEILNFMQFPTVPGYYSLDFKTKVDGKGNPVISLSGAKFIAGVTFAEKKVS